MIEKLRRIVDGLSNRLPAWLRWAAAVGWALFLWNLSARPASGGRRSQTMVFIWNGGHVAAYFVLGFLLWLALREVAGGSSKLRGWLAALGAGIYGAVDEWHQSFVPGRDCSLWDMASDVFGALLAAVSMLWLERRVGLHWMLLLVIAALCSVAGATF